jgi:anti-sigma regulatory factor (Ser/Thr protein kinase)
MVASAFSLLHADLPLCIGYQAGGQVETRHCLLPARAESVSAARRFVREVSASWSPRPSNLDAVLADLGVVVSELVTNALLHAYALPSSPARGSEAGPVSMCVIHEPCDTAAGIERVVFAVADPSADSPLTATADSLDGGLRELRESGRGMTLVEALADDWGWRRVRGPEGGRPAGKVVWASFELAC